MVSAYHDWDLISPSIVAIIVIVIINKVIILAINDFEMEGSNKEQGVGWCRQPGRLEIIGKLVTVILH